MAEAWTTLPATALIPGPVPVARSLSPSPPSSAGDTSPIPSKARLQRPTIRTRRSSGTMVVPRDSLFVELQDEEYDEDDARMMSPARSMAEIERMSLNARATMIEQAKTLQASLLALVDRVEAVKEEHERLEGGNKFLQSYIGELMQTSKITAAGAGKTKGKRR